MSGNPCPPSGRGSAAAATIKRLLREDIQPTGENGGARIAGQSRNTRVTDSDTSDRVVATLKKRDPDLAAQVVAGTITPNAAAIQAGIRKPRAQFRTDDVALAVAALLNHFTPQQISAGKRTNGRWARGSVVQGSALSDERAWQVAMSQAGLVIDWRPDLTDQVIAGDITLNAAAEQAEAQDARRDWRFEAPVGCKRPASSAMHCPTTRRRDHVHRNDPREQATRMGWKRCEW